MMMLAAAPPIACRASHPAVFPRSAHMQVNGQRFAPAAAIASFVCT
jgi:hypothetical protein